MELSLYIVMFVVALGVLIKSADFFVDTAEKLGAWLGISPFIIGVTIVALGTSLPELVTAIIAVNQNSSEIVLGSVLGSNIANILLVLGVAALFSKSIDINFDIFEREMPMFFASGLLLAFVIWPLTEQDQFVTLGESIVLVIGYLVYIRFSIAQEEPDKKKKATKKKKKEPFPGLALAIFIGSLFGVFFGSQYTIEAVIEIAKRTSINKEVVAIIAVAIGTSLPELMVSVAAVIKNKHEMAFGNVAGSNIFNAFAVTGIPGLYASILGSEVTIPKTISNFAMPFFVFTYVVFLVVMLDKKITRMEGMVLILCYVLFVGKLLAFM